MVASPPSNCLFRESRQMALFDSEVSDTEQRLVITLAGVEVRGVMVPIIHIDPDAAQAGDARHRPAKVLKSLSSATLALIPR